MSHGKKKEVRISINDDGVSGTGKIIFTGISSSPGDSLDVVNEDFNSLIAEYYQGRKIELENKGWKNVHKKLYQESGKLMAEIDFNFDDISDLSFFRYKGTGPWMLYTVADGFFTSGQYESSNGTYLGANFPLFFGIQRNAIFLIPCRFLLPRNRKSRCLPITRNGWRSNIDMGKHFTLHGSYLLLIGLLVFSQVHPAFSQTFQLSGTITEHEDNDPIPGASLHILGTSRGARTNSAGHFHLVLDSGVKYAIRVTALGYRPDTIRVQLFQNKSQTIQLVSAPILGPQITISADASRTEARRIMHKVIDSKDTWQSQITNYSFDVYSKTSLRTKKNKKDTDDDDKKDTNATNSNILAIVESSADGYWKRDHGYAERINARKQTADIPADVNRVALVGIQNFYNDRMDFVDYNVVSPWRTMHSTGTTTICLARAK